MFTFQDLQAIPEPDRAEFVRKVISEHKSSDLYQTAMIADEYDRCRNRTIMQYEKTVTNLNGQLIRDEWSPNHKSTSNFFNIFVTQLNQYLLANGVSWKSDATGNRLGADFDTRLQQIGKAALCGGEAFGFFNYDHLEVFTLLEFAPLYDEENGALIAGVRFWQIDDRKPLRATLYEMDGYTNYLWSKDATFNPGEKWAAIGDGAYMQPKTPYILKIRESEADGAEIYDGENYPAFPIVPLWGNPHKQSEIVGLREKIDAYDLILNGYENDLDNAQIYWIIKGAGGLSGDDKIELLKFLNELRRFAGSALGEDQEITPVPVEIPYEARERLLDRLKNQLYEDAMIMNPENIPGGATATQIKFAYARQDIKADQFEYCVIDFLNGILKIVGITDEKPGFVRSQKSNDQEDAQTLAMLAPYLSDEYMTKRSLEILGDGDKFEEVMQQITEEEAGRFADESEDEAETEVDENGDVND